MEKSRKVVSEDYNLQAGYVCELSSLIWQNYSHAKPTQGIGPPEKDRRADWLS